MSHLAPTAQEIEERLKAALPLDSITVRDDSAKHHGHAGAIGRRGAFPRHPGLPYFPRQKPCGPPSACV